MVFLDAHPFVLRILLYPSPGKHPKKNQVSAGCFSCSSLIKILQNPGYYCTDLKEEFIQPGGDAMVFRMLGRARVSSDGAFGKHKASGSAAPMTVDCGAGRRKFRTLPRPARNGKGSTP